MTYMTPVVFPYSTPVVNTMCANMTPVVNTVCANMTPVIIIFVKHHDNCRNHSGKFVARKVSIF